MTRIARIAQRVAGVVGEMNAAERRMTELFVSLPGNQR